MHQLALLLLSTMLAKIQSVMVWEMLVDQVKWWIEVWDPEEVMLEVRLSWSGLATRVYQFHPKLS